MKVEVFSQTKLYTSVYVLAVAKLKGSQILFMIKGVV